MSALKAWSTSEREVTVRLLDVAAPARLSWGDGTAPVSVNPATEFVRHVYEHVGAYTITLNDGSAVLATERVFVRPGDAPALSWAPGADNPNFIDVTWRDDPVDLVSTYDVVWGDGTANEVVTAPAGFVRAHGYAAGEYTVKVYDRQARRWGQYDITVADKTYDPDLAVDQGDGRYAVVVTVSALQSPGTDVKVWWGDGLDPDVIANAQVGDQVRHTYDFDDTYLVQIGYADGSGEGGAVFVDIPWPARGTKPVSRIEWSPEPQQPTGIRAQWHGSGWNYTIHWGDGTQQRVRWEDPPTPHVYEQPGTYTVTAVSDLHADWTSSVTVTVRSSTVPSASFMLLAPGGNRVRASLGPVPEPVRYQVAWGGGAVTEHGAGDLEPVHEYPWNTPAPSILVRDMPAKRVGRFTGPAIGPSPTPVDVDGFYLEYVSRNADGRRFRLRGGGIPPGETLTWYPHHLSWYRDVTADANGEIQDEVDIPFAVDADFDHRWQSFGIVGTTVPRQYIPVHPPRAEAGEADLTYQIHVDGDPNTVEFSVTPPMLGEHEIDFGDGTQATIQVRTLPMRVKHTYTQTAQVRATVTLPDGRVAARSVRGYTPADPCFNFHYPGSCTVCWYFSGWPEHNCPPGGHGDAEEYSPVIIDNGYHPPHQIHRPENGSGWHVAFGYGMPVGQHVFKYSSTFTPTTEHPVTITKARFTRLDPPPIELLVLSDDDADVTAWFGDVTEWDGGYSGKFHVTNHTGAPVPWQVEFTLADPARVREVWPDSAQFMELGNGRWRIWSDLSINESIVVGARIEPPGKTRQWPDAIQGSVRTPPPARGAEEG